MARVEEMDASFGEVRSRRRESECEPRRVAASASGGDDSAGRRSQSVGSAIEVCRIRCRVGLKPPNEMEFSGERSESAGTTG